MRKCCVRPLQKFAGITHDHESFRNFTVAGIQVASKPVASAEILYYNCLFENCEAGLMLLGFNDYDNTLDHCEYGDGRHGGSLR